MRYLIFLLSLVPVLYFAFIPPAQGGIGGGDAHRYVFLLFGLFTPLLFLRTQLWKVWLGLLILAGAIELAQEALVAAELTKYRVGAWSDWLVGAASVSMGLACYDLCRSIGHFLFRLWGKVRAGKVLYSATRAPIITTGSASISPRIHPSPLSGSIGEEWIASTTSMPPVT